MARFDLSEKEWEIIAPLLPNKPRGVPRTDDPRVLNGIFYILRTGSPWRDLPERYGPYTTAYDRFNRWAKAGVWLEIQGQNPFSRIAPRVKPEGDEAVPPAHPPETRMALDANYQTSPRQPTRRGPPPTTRPWGWTKFGLYNGRK